MKKNIFNTLLLAVCCMTLLIGCNKDSYSGYAPKSVSGMTMNYRGKVITFFSNNDCTLSFDNSNYSIIGTPSCSYSKTSDNSATLTLSYSHKYYVTSSQVWDYSYDDHVTLYFISPNEGYASGSYSYTSTSYSGYNSGSDNITNSSFTIF